MFDLEPHETASDPEESWFRVQSEGPNRGQLWRVAIENRGQSGSGLLLMKRENWPVLVAAYAQKEPFRAFALGETSLDFSTSQFGLRTSMDDCLANEKWVRSLFLNAQCDLRKTGEKAAFQIVLSPHGWGLWRVFDWPSEPPYGNWYQAEWIFPTIRAPELAVLRAEEILSRLFSKGDETEDFRFARDFLKLPDAEQETHIWSWKRGDLAEFQSVLRMAFLAQEELWLEPRALTWGIDLSREVDRQWIGGTLHGSKSQIRTPATLKEALLRALNWFGFQVHHGSRQQHLCLSQLYKSRVRALQLSVEAREPTAHERLEAMLAWRDWLEEAGDQT